MIRWFDFDRWRVEYNLHTVVCNESNNNMMNNESSA